MTMRIVPHIEPATLNLKRKYTLPLVNSITTFDERAYRDLSATERLEVLENIWADGALTFWHGGFRELFFDEDINEEISGFVRDKIRARVNNPKGAESLSRKRMVLDYIGCL